MKRAPIHQIIFILQESFEELNVKISDKDVEHLGLLIHNSMIGNRRKFHLPEHVLSVMKDLKNPLQKLAVLFHDAIYFQVDGGYPQNLQDFLEDYAMIKGDEVFIIRNDITEHDTIFRLVLDIFRFSLGQKLSPFQGLNEFLSAVTAAKLLEPFLLPKQLATIITCIEATIPFRPQTEIWSFKQNENNIERLNNKYQLGYKAKEIENSIKLSVEVANADVLNFSDTNTGRFLDNTWLLIFESNNIQTNLDGYSYSIIKYRQGIMRTESFIRTLNPDNIFHEYKGTPTKEIFTNFRTQARSNLLIACEYLQIKLLLATILEAFAIVTGKDVPLSLLTGGVRNSTTKHQIDRVEDFLDTPKPLYENIEHQPEVLHLLEYGRETETSFDMKNSPLSAYVYKSLGSKRCAEIIEKARDLFSEKIYYYEFLDFVDKPIISALAKACAKVATTRAKALAKYF
ncbi:MAG: hypothetical protein EAZ85_05655 [Bacteroidetes bacterium]|nr:MAG: hypothetical protein EAZ85_05655 [Bacteroidota bacterium]TAG88748.1 MAG: hypothetical protein EAZ20_07850 [Bacteroidota bacterium]